MTVYLMIQFCVYSSFVYIEAECRRMNRWGGRKLNVNLRNDSIPDDTVLWAKKKEKKKKIYIYISG